MRKAVKSPSEWLRLLCSEWVADNEAITMATDKLFRDYKPYMKGLLSSQLLCRLSIQPTTGPSVTGLYLPSASCNDSIDFWKILGVHDSFDRSYIVAQVRKKTGFILSPPMCMVHSVL
jgi:hypothetical protein